MSWSTPKTNWDTHPKAIEPSDMNRIEGNILAVREQISIPLRAEVVDSFPPHAAGRIIYHTGNNKAYVSNGTEWLPIGIEGNAEAGHVLAGKIFSSQVAGAGIVGTMPNRGAHDIMPGVTDITIPAGYHNGNGVVRADIRRHIIPSDTVRVSADRLIRIYYEPDYTRDIIKKIKIGHTGICRYTFRWNIGGEGTLNVMLAYITINDGERTFQHSKGTVGPSTMTGDIEVERGDTIGIRLGHSGSLTPTRYAEISNFRLCYDYDLTIEDNEVLLD